MAYDDKLMVATGDAENPGEESVSLETINQGGGGGGGHTYDLEFNQGLDEVTLTEDSHDKTKLPIPAEYVGTSVAWNAMSAAEKAKYRIVIFTDDSTNGFDPNGLSNSTNTPVDADLFLTSESGVWYKKAASKLWDYIHSKIVTDYTSEDVSDGSANSWTTVTALSGASEPLGTILTKISQMFKNVRYLKSIIDSSISDTGWQNGLVDSDDFFYYRKIGKIVEVECYSTRSFSSRTWTTIFTLPSGYRPARTSYFPIILYTTAVTPGLARVDTNGVVSMYNSYSSSRSPLYGNFTFMV